MEHVAGLNFGIVVLLAFWTVLIAELVGDKLIYALASLALRFRWGVVFTGFCIASAAKMAVAVTFGRAIMHFQSHWTYLVSGVAFLISAVLIWVDEPRIAEKRIELGGWSKGALACFTSFFLTEWGDPGQIAVMALVLRSHLLLATWLGATLALMVKGAAALALGLQVRDRVPQKTLRILASGSCCILGMFSIGESIRLI